MDVSITLGIMIGIIVLVIMNRKSLSSIDWSKALTFEKSHIQKAFDSMMVDKMFSKVFRSSIFATIVILVFMIFLKYQQNANHFIQYPSQLFIGFIMSGVLMFVVIYFLIFTFTLVMSSRKYVDK